MPISNGYANMTFAEMLRLAGRAHGPVDITHITSTPTIGVFGFGITTNNNDLVRWTEETKILAFGIGEGTVSHSGELKNGITFLCHFPTRSSRYLVLGKDFIILNENEEFE